MACRSTASVWRYLARGSRTKGVSRSTVSMLCANTSRPLSATRRTQSSSPAKSGERHSTSRLGFSSFSSLR